MQRDLTLRRKLRSIRQNEYLTLYLFLLPAVVLVVVFCYVPIGGLMIAFQDFNIFKGIGGSPFVGLENFRKAFSDPYFLRAVNAKMDLSHFG